MPTLYLKILTILMLIIFSYTPAFSSDDNSKTKGEFMYLYKAKDAFKLKAIPTPPKHQPPKDTGLKNSKLLQKHSPIFINNNADILKQPMISGNGTSSSPYILENLNIIVKNKPAIFIKNVTKPLVIRNIKIKGVPISEYSPNKNNGIDIQNSKNIIIKNCKITKCKGIYLGGCNNIKIINCKLISIICGIMSSGGGNIVANYNYVEDSVKYGIFLYNGPNNEIGHNYIAWTGREGIGTNGSKCQNHYYHDNIISHSGWTAINLEGCCDNSKIENNLVIDSYYGMVLFGDDVLIKNNKVFYSGQDGLIILGKKSNNQKIVDNLIVGSSKNGIWLMEKTSGHIIKNNQILMSHVGINNDAENATIISNEIQRFFWAIKTSCEAVVKKNELRQGRNGISVNIGAKKQTNIYKSKNKINKKFTETTIAKNDLRYLCIGITIESGTCNSLINDNSFIYVGQQIRLKGCKKIKITNNIFRHQAYSAIELRNTSKVEVSKNRFDNATSYSIKINKGKKNIISNNKLSDVYAEFRGGAILLEDTNGNQVVDNKFKNCEVGIRMIGNDLQGNLIKGNAFRDSPKTIFLVSKDSDKPMDAKSAEEIIKNNKIIK